MNQVMEHNGINDDYEEETLTEMVTFKEVIEDETEEEAVFSDTSYETIKLPPEPYSPERSDVVLEFPSKPSPGDSHVLYSDIIQSKDNDTDSVTTEDNSSDDNNSFEVCIIATHTHTHTQTATRFE